MKPALYIYGNRYSLQPRRFLKAANDAGANIPNRLEMAPDSGGGDVAVEGKGRGDTAGTNPAPAAVNFGFGIPVHEILTATGGADNRA